MKKKLAAVLLVVTLAVLTAALARAFECYGGFNPNQTCSSQTTTMAACNGCCTIILDCNVFYHKNPHVCLSEYNACEAHCITDF